MTTTASPAIPVSLTETGAHMELSQSNLSQMSTTTTSTSASSTKSKGVPNKSSPPTQVRISLPGGSSRSSKRSSSSSNDLLHERDRFRARLHSLNTTDPPDLGLSVDVPRRSTSNSSMLDTLCDVCDGIGSKTTKLNMSNEHDNGPFLRIPHDTDHVYIDAKSPLDTSSQYFVENITDSFVATQSTNAIHLSIKSLSLKQLRLVFHWYFNKPLPPTNKMFPWLHGLNKDNFAQKSFFLHQQQQLAKGNNNTDLLNDFNLQRPRDIRFLICINIDEDHKKDDTSHPMSNVFAPASNLRCNTSNLPHVHSALKNTVNLNEILLKIDVSREEMKDTLIDIFKKVFNGSVDQSIIELFTADCIKLNHLPFFLNLDPDRGVSLRNFHIQVSKLSSCSDFLVYATSSSPSSPRIASCARILWLAQRYQAHIENLKDSQFNVFILNESVGDLLIEKQSEVKLNLSIVNENESNSRPPQQGFFDSIVPTSKETLKEELVWENDYRIKEKVESTRMSSATKINRNVWIGNYWDYQIMMTYLIDHNTSYLEHYGNQKDNLTGNLELKNLYCDPNNSIVTNKDIKRRSGGSGSLFDYLSLPKANWRLFIYCHNGASFPNLETLSSLLFKVSISSHSYNSDERADGSEQDYTLLDFPPSGSIGIGDCKKDNLMSIVNTCKLIYSFSSTSSKKSDEVLSSLIYCSDGYTELSLLVLSYVIYSQNICLKEAMLQLHVDYGRPFYIFQSDVVILKDIETLLRKFSPVTPGKELRNIDWTRLETLTNLELNDLLLNRYFSKFNSVEGNNALIGERKDINTVYGGFANDDDSLTSSSSSSDEDDSDSEYQSSTYDWVKDVEGSLPSRVLPYLYLGSLVHANCLPLLNKLGIKKIISVGEHLDWLNGYKFQRKNDVIVEEILDGNIELFSITPSAKCKQATPNSIDTVMKVNNLQDDGIDELSKSLPSILKYINDEYDKSNGKTKILVHCRVGVSRSATVVIAEVMRRLNVSLPDAYLYVRVRRLNIIIQPNLRFMYELFKWEEQEKLKLANAENYSLWHTHKSENLREMDWFIMCREIMKLNIPYLRN